MEIYHFHVKSTKFHVGIVHHLWVYGQGDLLGQIIFLKLLMLDDETRDFPKIGIKWVSTYLLEQFQNGYSKNPNKTQLSDICI